MCCEVDVRCRFFIPDGIGLTDCLILRGMRYQGRRITSVVIGSKNGGG